MARQSESICCAAKNLIDQKKIQAFSGVVQKRAV
jgi:hypothetical protein